MKQSYTSYLNVLSGTRLDVLENLVTNKYTKFRKFYKIVSKFSGDIAHMCYKFSEDSDSLDIDITVDPSIDPEDFIDEIKESCDDKYDISCLIDTKVVCMSIS